MRKLKILSFNLLLFFVLLFVVEVVLRVAYPDYHYYYRTHLGQPDLEEVLARKDADWLMPDANLGWVCQQKENLEFPSPPKEGVSYQINAEGFRNSFDFKDTFPEHKKRILLLGDSFMFGIYLEEDQTIASQLQKRKGQDYQFINIAVPAWGLDQMYLAYKKYVDLIQPDQVILAFVDDDLMRSLEIIFHGCGRKPCLKIEGDQLVNNEDNPQGWEYLCWNNQIGNRFLLSYYQQKAASLAQFILNDIIKQEKGNGRTPAFIRVPALVDLQNKEPRRFFSMLESMQEQEVPYLELYDTLAAQSIEDFSSFYIPDDGHFTEKGASMLTDYLEKWID